MSLECIGVVVCVVLPHRFLIPMYLYVRLPVHVQELAKHLGSPRNDSFDQALENFYRLRERAQTTGAASDKQRLDAADKLHVDMHVSWARGIWRPVLLYACARQHRRLAIDAN